jgi:ABC-type oligopeptide transport system substrate-binding subunit
MKKIAVAVALVAAVSLAACKKTADGGYEVQKPVIGTETDTVHPPTVEVGTDTHTVVTPKVEVKKDTTKIVTPSVKVTKP